MNCQRTSQHAHVYLGIQIPSQDISVPMFTFAAVSFWTLNSDVSPAIVNYLLQKYLRYRRQ